MPRLNTVRPDGRVLDPRGRVVGRLNRRQLATLRVQARDARISGLGQFSPSESVGAALWEFFNPAQVQEEYRAVGKPVPPVAEIMTGAADAAVSQAGEGLRQAVGNVFSAGKWVIVGLVTVGVIIVFSRMRSR
jgi:hypothetical protein